jgi:hypothetical protein
MQNLALKTQVLTYFTNRPMTTNQIHNLQVSCCLNYKYWHQYALESGVSMVLEKLLHLEKPAESSLKPLHLVFS